ncbi:hypothetical protein [Gordonia polyisoprenivorans]|nr:hypothetical protein [Gordonia polyisoprenivorans]
MTDPDTDLGSLGPSGETTTDTDTDTDTQRADTGAVTDPEGTTT